MIYYVPYNDPDQRGLDPLKLRLGDTVWVEVTIEPFGARSMALAIVDGVHEATVTCSLVASDGTLFSLPHDLVYRRLILEKPRAKKKHLTRKIKRRAT